jgi:formylglycine-generating enzyme required for sulfatase activity
MSDIFISYTRKDQPAARKLADALERKGWSVWWDPKLRVGEHFDDVIEQALMESRCVIVLWSERSVQSRYVKDEAVFALQRNKLVPLAIDEVALPFRFETIHTPRFIDWNGSTTSQAFRQLIETVQGQLGPSPAEQEEAKRKAEEEQRLAEEEAQRKAEEERRRAEEEAQRKAEEERRLAEEEAQRKAEEEQRLAEEEAQRKAEEERRRAEEEAQRKAEEEQRLAEEEAQRKAEEEQRIAEEEAQRKAEEEEHREESDEERLESPESVKVKSRTKVRFNPGETFRDTLKDVSNGPEMVVILAGTFLRAGIQGKGKKNERPVREVHIDKPFAMGKYPVTFEEYDKFAAAARRKKPNDRGWGRGNRPVINVSWKDAKAYAEWLSIETGKRYRLATEAEWEYAARAGTTTAYWWGNEIKQDGKVWANCLGCGSEWDEKQTSLIGSFEPNPWGLYDTAGNVWEWVEDCWHNNYAYVPIAIDEFFWRDWKDGGGRFCRRVIRGGSWDDRPQRLRSAARYWHFPVFGDFNVGFRLARDL